MHRPCSRLLLSLLAISLTAGCSSTPSSQSSQSSLRATEAPIYAQLNKDAGDGYEFIKFAVSEQDINTSLTWVRLPDNKPMFNTRSPSLCTETATLRPDYCSQDDEYRFMEAEVDGSALPKTVGVAVFTMGLSLIAGLPEIPVFQEDDYLNAVDQAKKRIPDFENKLNKIRAAVKGPDDAEYQQYLNQPKPEVVYKVWNQMPATEDDRPIEARDILDLRSRKFVNSFPEITLNTLPPLEASSTLRETASYTSLDQWLEDIGDATGPLVYEAECKFKNSVLVMDFKCPKRVPADTDQIFVDFFVNGGTIMSVPFPHIEPVRNAELTLSYRPLRDQPWNLTNHSSRPIALETMTIKRSVTERMDLRNVGIIEPGETRGFSLQKDSLRWNRETLRFTEQSKDDIQTWWIDVSYQTAGFDGSFTRRFSGSDTMEEVIEMAAVLESLQANPFDSKSLNERLNERW